MTTAARGIARETGQDKGDVATMTEFCGGSGGKLDSNGGGKSKCSAATTTEYGGRDGEAGKEEDYIWLRGGDEIEGGRKPFILMGAKKFSAKRFSR